MSHEDMLAASERDFTEIPLQVAMARGDREMRAHSSEMLRTLSNRNIAAALGIINPEAVVAIVEAAAAHDRHEAAVFTNTAVAILSDPSNLPSDDSAPAAEGGPTP